MKMTKEFLDRQRLKGDKEADAIIKEIFATNQQAVLYGLFKLEEKAIESQPNSEVKKFLIAQKPKPAWLNQKT